MEIRIHGAERLKLAWNGIEADTAIGRIEGKQNAEVKYLPYQTVATLPLAPTSTCSWQKDHSLLSRSTSSNSVQVYSLPSYRMPEVDRLDRHFHHFRVSRDFH